MLVLPLLPTLPTAQTDESLLQRMSRASNGEARRGRTKPARVRKTGEWARVRKGIPDWSALGVWNVTRQQARADERADDGGAGRDVSGGERGMAGDQMSLACVAACCLWKLQRNKTNERALVG